MHINVLINMHVWPPFGNLLRLFEFTESDPTFVYFLKQVWPMCTYFSILWIDLCVLTEACLIVFLAKIIILWTETLGDIVFIQLTSIATVHVQPITRIADCNGKWTDSKAVCNTNFDWTRSTVNLNWWLKQMAILLTEDTKTSDDFF